MIRSGLLSEHLKVLLAKLASTVIQRGAGIVGTENGSVSIRTPLAACEITTKRRLNEPEQIRETAGISTSPLQLLLTNGDREFEQKCLAPRW